MKHIVSTDIIHKCDLRDGVGIVELQKQSPGNIPTISQNKCGQITSSQPVEILEIAEEPQCLQFRFTDENHGIDYKRELTLN